MPYREAFFICAPLRCAQACGARKAPVLSLPSTYEPAWAQERAHAGSTCWATLFRLLRLASGQALRGWCLARPTVTAPIFIPLGAQATSTWSIVTGFSLLCRTTKQNSFIFCAGEQVFSQKRLSTLQQPTALQPGSYMHPGLPFFHQQLFQ
jgi:hypothetical protein